MNMASQPRILIMAGGTGGHVFPALAVAQCLRDRGVDVVWLGTRRGLESRVVPAAAFDFVTVPIAGLRGKGILGWILAPVRVVFAVLLSIRILLRVRPRAVLGMGGFVTGPGGIASWLLHRPLLIHEQNAIAGLTNRLLARFASVVMEAFPGAFATRYLARQTGNPVRAEIAAIASPDQRFAERSGALRVLVVGGSQGALALNKNVPAAIARLAAGQRPEIWHQTGQQGLNTTQALYQQAGVDARVAAFIDDMSEAYAWADVVICRAGALTIAELSMAGVASILVPFPYAVDDHQTANARYLETVGAAILMPEDRLTAEVLASLLTEFSGNRKRLLAMAQAARKQSHPEAAKQVADLCLHAMQVS